MESLSKSRVKLILSLQHKKFRLKYNKFIVEGLKIIQELIRERPMLIEEILVSNPDLIDQMPNDFPRQSIVSISPREMHQMSQMTTPPGIMAICTLPDEAPAPVSFDDKKVIYLDAIRDPGNLGTILRIADWFGMDWVLLSPDCVDIYNHKVLQSAMGSALRIRWSIMTAEELKALKNVNIMLADTGGKPLHQSSPPGSGILVLGNESRGVSKTFAASMANTFAISGEHSHGAESLNVAIAAAVMIAWWTKCV